MPDKNLSHLPLGRTVGFSPHYDPSQLCAVPRSLGRDNLGLDAKAPLPVCGKDIWNCWEVSWLDPKGKPQIGVLELHVPADSPFIVESKSLKLYLNSFNMTQLDSEALFRETVKRDISGVVGADIHLFLWMPEDFPRLMPETPGGLCIDTLDLDVRAEAMPRIISGEKRVSETFFSRLLRTNCPVTGQPDWATLSVTYTGKAISPQSLLGYIISLREHTGFHESCVETLFCTILKACQPEDLRVYARFTRRGGIDINPFRSIRACEPSHARDFRQ